MSQVPLINEPTGTRDAQCSLAIIAILKENLDAAERKLLSQFCETHSEYAAQFSAVATLRHAVVAAEREHGRRFRI